MNVSLISIIGPPAVGKTTLAELLAADLSAAVIFEDYQGNEFLSESYTGGGDALLPAQLYYLLSRIGQLSVKSLPADGLFISDYGFCQDMLFARARLTDKHFQLYSRIAARLEALVHPPDIMIHMDADETLLAERIAARGRGFERAMTNEFLARMRCGYNEIQGKAPCPIIRVDCNDTDVTDDSSRRKLVEWIEEKL